ncbi:MAG TPA: hypothetical protein VF008_01135 [Niastella sp.]
MTRIQFEQLSNQEQLNIIGRDGVFIAERIAAGNRVYLYIVHSFYVELLHELSNVNSQGLTVFKIFNDTSEFALYPDKADPERLFV